MVTLKCLSLLFLCIPVVFANPLHAIAKRAPPPYTPNTMLKSAQGLLAALPSWTSDLGDVTSDLQDLFSTVARLSPSSMAQVEAVQQLLVKLANDPSEFNDILSQINTMTNNLLTGTSSASPPTTTTPAPHQPMVPGGPAGPYGTNSLTSTTIPGPVASLLSNLESKRSDLVVRKKGNAPIPSQVDCAGRIYTRQVISAALHYACNYWINYSTLGSGQYPHYYSNFEGIHFPNARRTVGPFQEFPIKGSTVWNGQSGPGPDRLIFNWNGRNCDFLGVITHSASVAASFVSC